ncbi:MAG: hypothetical protein GY822_05415, partial [Deltaproteobacteria bacterium]|nr:hypothetical protein [Deltaproteobacteria bacterium]
GVRFLVQKWAKLIGEPVEKLARQWKVPWVIAKSTKGAFKVNWKDSAARSDVIARLAEGASVVVDDIRKKTSKMCLARHESFFCIEAPTS